MAAAVSAPPAAPPDAPWHHDGRDRSAADVIGEAMEYLYDYAIAETRSPEIEAKGQLFDGRAALAVLAAALADAQQALARHEIGDQEVVQILDACDGELSHMLHRGSWATSAEEVRQLLVPLRRKATNLRAVLAGSSDKPKGAT